jgi:iron complex transport system substrate-binding protein
MRIVSLVPSWTETLIEAGVNVVGRTRYCLHPADKVKKIPALGGTKEVNWEKIKALGADLVILDQEENTKEMAEECPVPWIATHVRSMQDLPRELQRMAVHLKCEELQFMAERWQKIIDAKGPLKNFERPPALISWETPSPLKEGPLIYTIWAHPWMAAGPNTFIGSVLNWCGWSAWGDEKYPRFEPELFKNQNATFLCSTEPYPFAKRKDVLKELPGAIAIVDGEKLSWFGLRSLKYLESLM